VFGSSRARSRIAAAAACPCESERLPDDLELTHYQRAGPDGERVEFPPATNAIPTGCDGSPKGSEGQMTDKQMTDKRDFFSASAELGRVKELDVAAMELLFQLECSGEDFYNGLADRIGDEQAAVLLRRNGREELGHARRIKRAIAIKLGGDYEPSAAVLERFEIPLPDSIGLDLFPIIVKAEIDGDAGYQRWADAETDPEVARLLRLNGREETVHGQRVSEALAILEAAQAS
jgi:Rubrerythrin